MCVNIEEIQKAIESRAKLTESDMKGEFALLNEKLDRISTDGANTLIQATKTNGRVTVLETSVRDLEENDRNKYINCPVKKSVRVLQDNALTNKTIISTIWEARAVIAGVITFLITVLGLIMVYM